MVAPVSALAILLTRTPRTGIKDSATVTARVMATATGGAVAVTAAGGRRIQVTGRARGAHEACGDTSSKLR